MRLARPVYEALPIGYIALGGLAMLVSYVDAASGRAPVLFALGVLVQIAGVTILLHRRDCRLRRNQYPCESIDDALSSQRLT